MSFSITFASIRGFHSTSRLLPTPPEFVSEAVHKRVENMAPLLLQARGDNETCIEISVDEIVFSKTTFFVVMAVCVAMTGLSLLALSILGWREWNRRCEEKQAREYGRASRYQQRVSMLRKEVDNSYSRQYSGCLVNEPENPFLAPTPSPRPRSPVELMHTERVCEVPAGSTTEQEEIERARKGRSLLFDNAKGQWFHRH